MLELLNKRLNLDSIDLLNKIEDSTVKCAFFDPQYRSVLDKLEYGNEGVRQKERVELPQMTDEFISDCIKLQSNKLVENGYLFLWIDKFILCEGAFKNWIKDTDLKPVDLITWDKCTFGMGYRTRRACEYLLVLQKSPYNAKSTWKNHSIPDVWSERAISKDHPHRKPSTLLSSLIQSVTDEQDIVLDIAAGTFIVFDVCRSYKRNFIGTDITFGTKLDDDDYNKCGGALLLTLTED